MFECGIHLCWDLSEEEYIEAKAFWDAWECEECRPGAKGSLNRWKAEKQNRRLAADNAASIIYDKNGKN